jgi:diacylglycerol kinase (CTP)
VRDAIRAVMRSWGFEGVHTGGWLGLGVLGVVAGLVAGVAEALGTLTFFLVIPVVMVVLTTRCVMFIDLGSLDDNLTLPIISGGCIWGFFKFLSLFSS